MPDPLPTPEPLEPEKIPVGLFVKRMPVGTLLTILGCVFGSGSTAGYWVRGQVEDSRLQTLQAQIESERKQALAQAKVAETLQQAIAAGHCVKSRELARTEAARALLARLAVLKMEADNIDSVKSTSGQINELNLDPSVLSYFIDDTRLTDHLATVTLRRFERIERQPELQWDPTGLEPFRRALVAAQEYIRARYLPLDPRPTAAAIE